jgi:hypothetical protein
MPSDLSLRVPVHVDLATYTLESRSRARPTSTYVTSALNFYHAGVFRVGMDRSASSPTRENSTTERIPIASCEFRAPCLRRILASRNEMNFDSLAR